MSAYLTHIGNGRARFRTAARQRHDLVRRHRPGRRHRQSDGRLSRTARLTRQRPNRPDGRMHCEDGPVWMDDRRRRRPVDIIRAIDVK